jgi:hypothetical protein
MSASIQSLLSWAGRLAGLAGMTIVAVAAFARLSGLYFLGGFQIGTLLLAGLAGVSVGCFLLLILLTGSRER